MNAPHLSEEQFGDLLSGAASGQTPAASAHLAACPQCRAELSDLRATLSLYRDTVIPFAEAQAARAALHARRPPVARAHAPRTLAWSLGAAATLALVSATVGGLRPHVAGRTPAAVFGSGARSGTVRPAEGSTAGTSEAVEDDRLLSEISQDLSTPLPPSLAPLAGQMLPAGRVQAAGQVQAAPGSR